MDGAATEVSHDSRIARVIEQGQGGIDGATNEDRFLPSGGAEFVQFGNFVGVELYELETAQHQGAYYLDLILIGLRAKVTASLEAAGQEAGHQDMLKEIGGLTFALMPLQLGHSAKVVFGQAGKVYIFYKKNCVKKTLKPSYLINFSGESSSSIVGFNLRK